MPKLVKVKDSRIIIKIKKDSKVKLQEYATKKGVTVTDVLTDFIEKITTFHNVA